MVSPRKSVSQLWLFSLLSFFLFSCQPDRTATSHSDENPESGNEAISGEPEKNDPMLRFSWVDQLNLRDAPATTGNIVGSVDSQTPLSLTGEQSPEPKLMVLRGKTYQDSWYKVKTAENQEGWVYGGAIRKAGEEKGNGIISETQLDFEHFGKFDLTQWEEVKSGHEAGGDAEIEITRYQKGEQKLEVSYSEMGEYGYSRHFKLMEKDGTLLKERRFSFMFGDPSGRDAEESVIDYTINPAMEYTRKQHISQDQMYLGLKPEMASTEWTQKELP
ncbi:MAG: SH3 domain-containing protein [Bacteroidota bacterium]